MSFAMRHAAPDVGRVGLGFDIETRLAELARVRGPLRPTPGSTGVPAERHATPQQPERLQSASAILSRTAWKRGSSRRGSQRGSTLMRLATSRVRCSTLSSRQRSASSRRSSRTKSCAPKLGPDVHSSPLLACWSSRKTLQAPIMPRSPYAFRIAPSTSGGNPTPIRASSASASCPNARCRISAADSQLRPYRSPRPPPAHRSARGDPR